MAEIERVLRTTVESAVRRRPAVVAGYLAPDRSRHVAAAGDPARPDGAAADGRTLFEIGSISKAFTSILLADASLRGEVALDQPLRELLPAGAGVPSRDGREITLEHLATHRSRLPRSPLGRAAELRSALVDHRNPYAAVTSESLLESLAAAELKRVPGSGKAGYSNFGVSLLGLALERAAGEPWPRLVADRICRPLGLPDTVVEPSADQDRRLARGTYGTGKPAESWWLPGMAAAGALRSTADDLLRFLDAQLHPDEHALGPALRLTHERRWSGRRHAMGLGWVVVDLPGGVLHWHNGGTGGYRAFAGFSADQGHAVVALTNSTRGVDRAAFGIATALST